MIGSSVKKASVIIVAFFLLQAICAGAEITWTGKAKNASWDDSNNWNPKKIPESTDEVVIGINFEGSGYSGIYPILGDSGLGYLDCTITKLTINSGAEISLNGNRNISTGIIENHGFINYNSSGRITDGGPIYYNTLNDANNNGWVVYNGSACALDNVDFANLEIIQTSTTSVPHNIQCKNDLRIGDIKITFNGNVMVDGELNVGNSADISFSNLRVGTPLNINCKNISLDETVILGGMKITATEKISLGGTIKANNFEFVVPNIEVSTLNLESNALIAIGEANPLAIFNGQVRKFNNSNAVSLTVGSQFQKVDAQFLGTVDVSTITVYGNTITKNTTTCNSFTIYGDFTSEKRNNFPYSKLTVYGSITNHDELYVKNLTIEKNGAAESSVTQTKLACKIEIQIGGALTFNGSEISDKLKISGGIISFLGSALRGGINATNCTIRFENNCTINSSNTFDKIFFGQGIITFNDDNTFSTFSANGNNIVIKFASGKTYIVKNEFSLNGTSKDGIKLESTTNGSQWKLKYEGSVSPQLKNISVKDSDASLSTIKPLKAKPATDGGNNIDWFFETVEPPHIAFTIAPIGTKNVYVFFSCPIRLVDSVGVGIRFDEALSVSKKGVSYGSSIFFSDEVIHVFSNDKTTCLRFSFSSEIVTIDMIQNYYLKAEWQCDSIVSLEDETLTMLSSEQHVLSDFAVNAVEVEYAYTGESAGQGKAVRWSKNQSRMKSAVPSGDTFHLVAKYNDYAVDALGNYPASAPILHFTNEVLPSSLANEINSVLGLDYKIWLPEVLTLLSTPNPLHFNASGNSFSKSFNGTLQNTNQLAFRVDNIPNIMKQGSEVSFLFELDGIKTPDGNPLYCLWQNDVNDVLSLDLWATNLRYDLIGGVGIFNNVIDVNKGSECTIQVDVPKAGSLSVMLMTLDGDVIAYLQKGNVSKGKYTYKWAGSTKGGKKVARGIYFVRVVGCGLDETRKIMVVK